MAKSPIALYKELNKLGIERPNEFLATKESLARGKVVVDLMKLDDWASENGMRKGESLKDFLIYKECDINVIQECF